MLTSASGRCVGADGAVGARHAVVEQHHVVLDHAEPARLGILPRSRRVLFALQRLALLDVGAGAVQPRLLVVPQREADGAFARDVGHREDARQLHHERRAGAVVVGGFAPAVAIHVRADDVHLVRARGADFGAIDQFAPAVGGRFAVEGAQPLVRLPHRVGVDAGTRPLAARTSAADGPGIGVGRRPRRRRRPSRGRRRVELVDQALGGAAVALELRLDPVDGLAVALGALPPIPELRQALDGGLVAFEVQPGDESPDRVRRGGSRRRCLRRRAGREADSHRESKQPGHPAHHHRPPGIARQSTLIGQPDPPGRGTEALRARRARPGL